MSSETGDTPVSQPSRSATPTLQSSTRPETPTSSENNSRPTSRQRSRRSSITQRPAFGFGLKKKWDLRPDASDRRRRKVKGQLIALHGQVLSGPEQVELVLFARALSTQYERSLRTKQDHPVNRAVSTCHRDLKPDPIDERHMIKLIHKILMEQKEATREADVRPKPTVHKNFLRRSYGHAPDMTFYGLANWYMPSRPMVEKCLDEYYLNEGERNLLEAQHKRFTHVSNPKLEKKAENGERGNSSAMQFDPHDVANTFDLSMISTAREGVATSTVPAENKGAEHPARLHHRPLAKPLSMADRKKMHFADLNLVHPLAERVPYFDEHDRPSDLEGVLWLEDHERAKLNLDTSVNYPRMLERRRKLREKQQYVNDPYDSKKAVDKYIDDDRKNHNDKFSGPGNAFRLLPYQYQGDADMYMPDKMHARAALKEHASIHKCTAKFFAHATKLSAFITPECMGKDEYLRLMLNCYLRLVPNWTFSFAWVIVETVSFLFSTLFCVFVVYAFSWRQHKVMFSCCFVCFCFAGLGPRWWQGRSGHDGTDVARCSLPAGRSVYVYYRGGGIR